MKLTVRNTFARICISALVLLVVGLTALNSIAAGQETKRVFVLNSYHRGFTFSDNEMRGIDDAFDKSGIKVETYVTHMDMKRIPTIPKYFWQLKELIREGYKGVRFDAVLACDNDALEFMRKYRDELFPGAPVVFSAINDFDERMLDGRRDITGTIENTAYASTIGIALKLRPATKNIVVVTDNTTTGKAHRSNVDKIRSDFPQSLGFTHISLGDMTMDELAQKLSKLNSDSIVLLLVPVVDRNGTYYTVQESTSLLAKSSPVPIFVVVDSRMGFGALGGHLVSGYSQGETAAQMVVKILGGADVSSIPVLLESPNKFMFDYSVMQRFSIPESDLPQGSILTNKPVSALDKYRPQMFAMLGAFICLSGILVYLLLEVRRRKRVEDALRESEEWHRTILHTAMDGFWLVDLQGHLLEVNEAYCRMSGYSKEELLTMSISDMEAVEPDAKTAVHMQEVMTRGDDRFETWHHRKDGSVFEVEVSVQYKPSKEGQLVAFLRDITDRKQAEQSLKESEEKYRSIFENAVEGFFQSTPEGRFLTVNPAFARIFGYASPEELISTIFDISQQYYVNHEDRRRYMEILREKGTVENFEFKALRKDGAAIWISNSTRAIADKEGKIIRYEGIVEDITPRKRAEEEKRNLEERLNRAEKMEALGLLAGGVAHDLNNVLGVVVGYAELVLMKADESSSIRPHLVNIMNGGLKAAAIVDDLLTLARRGVSDRDVLNLNKIISDCQKSPEFETLYSYHPAVKIKTELDPDLLNISCSSVHLGKSLFNLISNASEAMPKGGSVTVKTTNQYLDKPIQGYDQIREGDYVVLSVSDTGEGISADNLERIFEPFYTKKVMGRSGTGLGLAVVWGTVKDHQGYINVQSEEGKGSTFTLYFPVIKEDITADAVAAAISEYMGQGESILVVDDVKEQRDLAAGMLRALNYNVASVVSGEEAIVYMQDHQVDLMVLDMIMDPGMDGLETYKNILAIHPKQRAIIVSGFSESDRVKAARGLGAGAYVRKPYIKEKLGLAVRKELDRK